MSGKFLYRALRRLFPLSLEQLIDLSDVTLQWPLTPSCLYDGIGEHIDLLKEQLY